MTKLSDSYGFGQAFLILFQCILEIYKAASNISARVQGKAEQE